MRVRLLVAASLIVLLALAVGFMVRSRLAARSAPVEAAERFFALVGEGRLYDAYRSTASVIRGDNFERFERSILDTGLDQYAESTWRMLRRGTGNEERMEGEIRTRNGQQLPFSVGMVREAGRWRVLSIVSEQRGSVFRSVSGPVESEPVPTTPPTEAQARALVLDTLLRFNEAVQIRFFGPFYQQVSSAWQSQTSPEDLQRAFAAFIENRVSFGLLTRAEPVFTSPIVISPEGLLVLNGDCATDAYIIRFGLKYAFERGKWRLFGIDINLLAPNTRPATTP